MKRKRILLCILCSMLLLFTMTVLTVHAHPGNTDSKGGHMDRSTGEYHYHHGYEAHDHTDIDGDGILECPYNFDDQTASSSPNTSKNTNGSDSYVNLTPYSIPTSPQVDKVYPTYPSAEVTKENNSTRGNFAFNIGRLYFACSFISIFVMIFLYHLFDYVKPRSEKGAKLILNIWSIIGLVFLLTTILVVFPYAKHLDKKKVK